MCLKSLGTKTITKVQKWIMKSRGCFYLVQSDFYVNRHSKNILEYDSHVFGSHCLSPHFSLSKLAWNSLRTALIFLTYFHKGPLVEAPDHKKDHFVSILLKISIILAAYYVTELKSLYTFSHATHCCLIPHKDNRIQRIYMSYIYIHTHTIWPNSQSTKQKQAGSLASPQVSVLFLLMVAHYLLIWYHIDRLDLRVGGLWHTQKRTESSTPWKIAYFGFFLNKVEMATQTDPRAVCRWSYNRNLCLRLPVSSHLGEKNEVNEVLWKR